MSPWKAFTTCALLGALVAGCGEGPANEFVLRKTNEPAARATPERSAPAPVLAPAVPRSTREPVRRARHRDPVRRRHRGGRHAGRPGTRPARHRVRREASPRAHFRVPQRPGRSALPEVTGGTAPEAMTWEVLQGDAAARELHLAGNAMRRYVELLDAHDPAVCTEAMTRGMVETVTRRQGDAAIAKCRQDVGSSVTRVRLVGFGAGRALPDRAYVEYTTEINLVRHTDIARLVKEGDRYLMDGDGSRDVRHLE